MFQNGGKGKDMLLSFCIASGSKVKSAKGDENITTPAAHIVVGEVGKASCHTCYRLVGPKGGGFVEPVIGTLVDSVDRKQES